MSIAADMCKEYAMRAAQERDHPVFWTGHDIVKTTGKIFYKDSLGNKFLEPYAAEVLGIKLVRIPLVPNPYDGPGRPEPTG